MILPPRAVALLESLRDHVVNSPDDDEHAADLADRITALLREGTPGERPGRQVELFAELQADGAVDFDRLKGELAAMLDDVDGTQSEQHRAGGETGSWALAVCVTPGNAAGDAYRQELATWRAAADADRNG